MTSNKPKMQYVPGTYARRRPDAGQMAQQCILEWEQHRMQLRKKRQVPATVHNCISFSRKIGVGALEIADIAAKRLGFKVVDRQILAHIAENRELRESTIAFFDEQYPGAVNELGSMLFGEKSYTSGDYMRHLASAVYAIAASRPTIFVGRATHLILPREKVLAVRFISSQAHRASRVAKILSIAENEAERILEEHDYLQRVFFRKHFGKKEAPADEFDMVLNCDYISDPAWAASIVVSGYDLKFGAGGRHAMDEPKEQGAL